MSDDVRRVPGPDGQLKDQAADWIARLRASDVAASDREAFSRWLMRSPAHRRAFDDCLDLWEDLGVIGELPLDLPAVPIERGKRHSPLAVGWMIAATLALCALVLPWLYRPAEAPVAYRTAVGEQRIVLLTDGSRLSLNADSEVRTASESHARRVELLRGEALFEVAQDRERPFIVSAGNARATALGTVFDVDRRPREFVVSVLEGRVEISHDADRRSAVLTKAHVGRLRPAEPGAPIAVRAADPARMASWREQRLTYDGVPLSDVLYDLNRYLTRKVRLADPALGNERVVTSLKIGSGDKMLDAIATSMNLEVVAAPDGRLLRRRQAERRGS